jgi:uncharacterized protein YeaO (DUF488 family)
MAIRIVQLGSPRNRNEGLRIGTVRRPPRGVRRSEYGRQNWYDVWLPSLAPSAALMRQTSIVRDKAQWRMFERRFLAELKRPDQSHLLDTLAAFSHQTNFSLGCYCSDEQRCHRSILRRVLQERGADVRGDSD